MVNNKYSGFGIMFLMVSLVFLIPMNMGTGFAAENQNALLDGQTTLSDAANECSLVPPLDVKSSIILSIVFMCIPGILEKAQEWKQIKCDLVACKYEAVSNSLDPSFCDEEEAFKTCKYFVGEVFAIPPMSIIEYLKDKIAEALANPVGLAWGVAANMIRKYAYSCTADCYSVTMGASMLFLGFTDITAALQTFEEMSEEGYFPTFEDEESTCDSLSDIKTEMEAIISAG